MIAVTEMTSRQTEASEAALIPPFLGKHGCSVTFVVDGSENMRAVLGSAKRLLIQTLLTKASLGDSLFNIMTFSGKVRRGSDNRDTATQKGHRASKDKDSVFVMNYTDQPQHSSIRFGPGAF